MGHQRENGQQISGRDLEHLRHYYYSQEIKTCELSNMIGQKILYCKGNGAKIKMLLNLRLSLYDPAQSDSVRLLKLRNIEIFFKTS